MRVPILDVSERYVLGELFIPSDQIHHGMRWHTATQPPNDPIAPDYDIPVARPETVMTYVVYRQRGQLYAKMDDATLRLLHIGG